MSTFVFIQDNDHLQKKYASSGGFKSFTFSFITLPAFLSGTKSNAYFWSLKCLQLCKAVYLETFFTKLNKNLQILRIEHWVMFDNAISLELR